jgi:Beta-propeller repeat
VTKFTALGALAYSTYLGGSGFDQGFGIAVDGSGQAYVTGLTVSGDFPTLHASQPASGGNGDAFVTKITSTSLVNDLVTLVPVPSTYRTTANPTGCPSGFVGTFSFDAWLTNKTSSPPLSDLAVRVKTLTNGNLLHNADGGNGGVGSTLTVLKKHGYADGTLSRSEFVDVHFNICLKAKKPFTFFVDVLGMH